MESIVAKERNLYLGVNCNVVVSLVRRSTSIATHASTYQDLHVVYMDYAMKRARLSNLGEYKVNLRDVHMNSSQLRRCSKYFDACLSERWAGGAEITPTFATPMRLTLDVHTDKVYYEDCFSRMYSNKYKWIPNVNHCLKLLQVASQISYLEVVEDCVRYLTSIPWSPIEEESIRQFANSMFYHSDCAADLSARLGLVLTDSEKHNLLLDITGRALCQCFDDFLKHGLDDDVKYCEQLFSSGFRLITTSTLCHTLVENVLQHVQDGIKELILQAKKHPKAANLYYKVEWTLALLLQTRFATGLVEYIMDESPLCETLKTIPALRPSSCQWSFTIFLLFREAVGGRLLLKTSTRYKLIKEWTWVLVLKNYGKFVQESDVYDILSKFVMTLPYKMQREIISDWMAYYTGPAYKEQNLHFVKIQEDWFASLVKKMSSYNP